LLESTVEPDRSFPVRDPVWLGVLFADGLRAGAACRRRHLGPVSRGL